MAAATTTLQTIPEITAAQFDINLKVNANALTTKRVFLTNVLDPSAHVYVRSESMFVEVVEANIVKCRCIDDNSKSFLDELDFRVLAKFNESKASLLPASVGPNNLRNNIKFTREFGSYIPLIITDKLVILDVDGKTNLQPHQLKHKIVKVIFSPLCVDVNEENKFAIKFYGFTIQVVKEVPPTYILLELNEEGTPYVGGEIEESKATVQQTTTPNFGANPFG